MKFDIVPQIRPTSSVVTNHEIPGFNSRLQTKKATALHTHSLFASYTDQFLRDEGKSLHATALLATSHQAKWHLQWLSPTPKASDLQVSWIESRKLLFWLKSLFPPLSSNADTEVSAHQFVYRVAENSKYYRFPLRAIM